MESHVLYTYQTVDGQLACHAYGPTDQATAQATGENLARSAAAAGEPTLGFMVLPLEAMPV